MNAASNEVARRHFVYIVRCANGSLYTGYSVDVARRVEIHNAGRGARYTRSNRPVTLVATWEFESKSEALRAERTIKRMRHEQKVALIADAGPGGAPWRPEVDEA